MAKLVKIQQIGEKSPTLVTLLSSNERMFRNFEISATKLLFSSRSQHFSRHFRFLAGLNHRPGVKYSTIVMPGLKVRVRYS
jgi:hypothetical protein